ncbi:MAG: ATP-dependent metallopeptidase FtsH/Yme1/Tma family protein, partial [Clostridia bacterium]|nr:ATP-dependent metallopeptidase FtsH/Yme1/Tma family protein [Clostridia bacterium]
MFNNGSPDSKKPLLYYIAIAASVILLMNAFLFPSLLSRQVQEVGYSDFLSWVDSGKVSVVSLDQQNDQIIFLAKNEEDQDQVYKTAVFPDDGLRARLEAAGVKFSAQIPTQNSPLLSFIISWILPVVLFSLLGRFFMGQLNKRMGDGMNVMNFGKSNAKIVADKETGVTFADVAGEEEAKDALKEIVDFLEHPDKYAGIG